MLINKSPTNNFLVTPTAIQTGSYRVVTYCKLLQSGIISYKSHLYTKDLTGSLLIFNGRKTREVEFYFDNIVRIGSITKKYIKPTIDHKIHKDIHYFQQVEIFAGHEFIVANSKCNYTATLENTMEKMFNFVHSVKTNERYITIQYPEIMLTPDEQLEVGKQIGYMSGWELDNKRTVIVVTNSTEIITGIRLSVTEPSYTSLTHDKIRITEYNVESMDLEILTVNKYLELSKDSGIAGNKSRTKALRKLFYHKMVAEKTQ